MSDFFANLPSKSIDMRRLFALLLLFGSASYLNAQCSVNIVPDTIFACISDTITISSHPDTGYVVYFDQFETTTAGPEWTTLPLKIAPCPPNNSPADSIVAWFDMDNFPNGSLRKTSLSGLDLTYDTSYVLHWDMKYGDVSISDYCEDPEVADEGVGIQIEAPGGNWLMLTYFAPNSNTTGPLYSWNSHSLNLPSAYCTDSTNIRWYQFDYTGEIYDHWGIDNVSITKSSSNSPGNASYEWYRNGAYLADSQDVVLKPVLAGTYVVKMTTNYCTAFDTVEVVTLPPPQPDLGNDTILNLSDSLILDVGCAHCNYYWSTGETVPSIILDTSDLGAGSHIVWVEVSRGNSCSVIDWMSVTFTVLSGQRENRAPGKLEIYPNPGEDFVYVNAQMPVEGEEFIRLYDANMNLLRDQKIYRVYPEPYKVMLPGLKPGIYFIEMHTGVHAYQSVFIRK